MTTAEASVTIAQLNDQFRKGDYTLGHQKTTAMVKSLSLESQRELFRLVRNFDRFDEENDPYHEHDFSSIELENQIWYWKIDYFDLELRYRSEDPGNPAITRRVMTIMHNSEY